MGNGTLFSKVKKSGDTMTGTLISQPGPGTSWIKATNGDSAGIYIKKRNLNENECIPGLTIQTKEGGGWAIANYNDENLDFVYGTKANIDSNTNTVSRWQITSEGVFTGTANFLKTPNTGGYYTDVYGNFIHTTTNASNSWNITNNAGTGKFRVVYESGDVTVGNWKASIIDTQYGGTGNANGTVAKLTTARTVQTNLASTATASFDGSANITPGVTGILGTGNGGTGNKNGTIAKLTTARTIQTNLGSTSSASFDGSANITPGVTGTLKVANGGTEATTPDAACAKLGAVKKSGDTMTGNLTIQHGVNGAISMRSTVYGPTVAPSKTVWPFELGCLNKDGTYFGYLAWTQETDKAISARLIARYQPANENAKENHLILRIDPNGGASIIISHPKAWCDALGANSTGNCILASNVTGTCLMYYWGRMGFIRFQGVKKSTTSSGWTTLATLPSGYSAIDHCYGQIFDDSNSVSGYHPLMETRIAGSNVQMYAPAANVSYWGGFAFILA